jgi:hypothetical protein
MDHLRVFRLSTPEFSSIDTFDRRRSSVRSFCAFFFDASTEIWLNILKNVTPKTTITKIRLTQSISPLEDRDTAQRSAPNAITKNMIHVRRPGCSIQILYSPEGFKFPGIDPLREPVVSGVTIITSGYLEFRYSN